MSPQFRQEWAPDGPGLIGAAETTLWQHCGRNDDLAPAGQCLRGAEEAMSSESLVKRALALGDKRWKLK